MRERGEREPGGARHAHRDEGSGRRHRGQHHVNPDATPQAHIDRRGRLVDVTTAARDEPHRERSDIGLIGEPPGLMAGAGTAVDPQPLLAVDEQIGDRAVGGERLERAEHREVDRRPGGRRVSGLAGRPDGGICARGVTRIATAQLGRRPRLPRGPRRAGHEGDAHAASVGNQAGPGASDRSYIGKEPPPRRCGGGLDPLRSRAVNERGRHPLGGTGAASAAQGLGGITSAAGLETSVRAQPSLRLAEGCASIICPHLCGHTEFSAQKHSIAITARSEEHKHFMFRRECGGVAGWR